MTSAQRYNARMHRIFEEHAARYSFTYAALPLRAYAMADNGLHGEVAVYRDEDGRVTRLWDGTFIDGLVADARFRVVTRDYAVQAAKNYRSAA
jgi:hypothetical protein